MWRGTLVGLGAIALAGTLMGCGGNALADRKQQMIATANTEAAKTQLEALDAEQLYLMAYSSCPMLQSGATVDSLSQQFVAQTDDPATDPSTAMDFFAAIVSVAETTVCPEDFEGWTGTP
jgi:hypothetical protein